MSFMSAVATFDAELNPLKRGAKEAEAIVTRSAENAEKGWRSKIGSAFDGLPGMAKPAFGKVESAWGETVKGMAQGVGQIFGSKVIDGALGFAGAMVGGIKEASGAAGQLQAQLGLTGAEAQKAAGIARTVWSNNFGGSIGEVTSAVATLKQNISGMSDSATEEVAGLALTLEQVFGASVEESSRTVGVLTKNFAGLSESQAFDLIATGFQKGGDYSGELLDTLREYAPQFAQMGFSADQMLGILISGAQAGAFNLDKVGDAIKEFNIRTKDGSTTTADAFKALGLNADQMSEGFAQGGEKAQSAFAATAAALSTIEDPLKRNQIGVALFGTQWEDIGPQVIEAMTTSSSAVEGFEGATKRAGDAANKNVGAAFEGLKRAGIGALLQGLSPLFDRVATDVNKMADAIKQPAVISGITHFGTAVADGVGMAIGWLERLPDRFRSIMNIFKGTESGSGFEVINNLAPMIDKAGIAFSRADEAIQTFLHGFTQIKDVIGSGDFKGGGPFSEDSPLISGLFRAKDIVSDLTTRFPMLGTALGAAGGGAAAGGLLVALPAIVGGLGSVLPIVTPLLSVLPALGTAIGVMTGPIGLAAAAVAVLAVAWSQNWGDIQGKTEGVVNAITPLLGQLGTVVTEQVVPALSAGWDAVKGTISGAVDAVSPLVERFVGYFSSDLGPQLAAIGQQIGPVVSSIFGTIGTTIDALRPGLESLGSSFMALGSAALPIITKIGTTIIDSIDPAIDTVMGFARETIPLIGTAFQGIASVVTPILQTVIGVVTSGLSGLASFITSNQDTILSVFGSVWSGVQNTVSLAWNLVSGIIRTGLQLLSGDWSGAWNTIGTTLTSAWGNIEGIVTSGWNTIQGLFTLGGQALKGIATSAWDGIKGAIQTASDGIASQLDTWSSALSQKFSSAADGIKNAILMPFTGARDAIGGIAGAISENMLGPFRNAIGGIGRFGGGVASVVNWLAEKLKVGGIGTPPVPGLAKGTSSWGGGWAWVGEGPNGKGAELAFLPTGAVVVPHDQSMDMVRQGIVPHPNDALKSGPNIGYKGGGSKKIPGFVGGLGDIPGLSTLLDFFKGTPEAILQKAIDAIGIPSPSFPGLSSDAGGGLLKTVKGWITGQLKEWISKALPVSGESMQRMVSAAQSQIGLPYLWGGGHGIGGPGVGFDCSGFVAWVLDQGGISNPHGIVTSFYNWMAKNGGNGVVDIGVNNPNDAPEIQHIGIKLLGTQYESGGPFGGVGVNGTRFGEWGTPPNLDLAKGGGRLDRLAAKSFEAIMGGRVQGQWSAGQVPSLSALDKVAPRFFSPDGISRLAAAIPGIEAYANGGWINEPVFGFGANSGKPYIFGESGPEFLLGAEASKGGAVPGTNPTNGLPAGNAGGMIGHFPEPVDPYPGRPGFWVGRKTGAIYSGDGTMVVPPLGAASSIASGLGSAPNGGGMLGHFPEPVTPNPNVPGQWIGVNSGKIYNGDGSEVKAPTLSINLPSSPTPLPKPTSKPNGGGMIGHFPEPVAPNPNKPGTWVGLETGTLYNGDGTVYNPAASAAAATIAANTSSTPTGGSGGQGGASAGGGGRIEIGGRIEFDFDGQTIVGEIIEKTVALDDLSVAVTQVQIRNARAAAANGPGQGKPVTA